MFFLTVSKSEYLFAQNMRVTGDQEGAVVASGHELKMPRAAYGFAIAPQSEVRGVAISGPRLDSLVIEGAPISAKVGAGSAVKLRRHDWTDGDLVLACAESCEERALLPRFVSPRARVAFLNRGKMGGHFYMQGPRAHAGDVQVHVMAKNHGPAIAGGADESRLSLQTLTPDRQAVMEEALRDMGASSPHQFSSLTDFSIAISTFAVKSLNTWAHGDVLRWDFEDAPDDMRVSAVFTWGLT